MGEYIDACGTYHGFLWHRGRFTTIDAPRAIGTALTNINDRGQLVGAYIAADGSYRGFLLSRGDYETFAAPKARSPCRPTSTTAARSSGSHSATWS